MRWFLTCLISCSLASVSITAMGASAMSPASYQSLRPLSTVASPASSKFIPSRPSLPVRSGWIKAFKSRLSDQGPKSSQALPALVNRTPQRIYRLLGGSVSRFSHPDTERTVGRGASTWSATTAPSPTKVLNPEAEVYSVVCDATKACTAIGTYENAEGVSLPMILTRSAGGSWKEVEAPLPTDAALFPGSGPAIYDLACPKQGDCVAVGAYTTADAQEALIETETGGTWKATRSPLPSEAGTPDPAAELNSVSCTSAGSCEAVGDFQDDNGNEFGLTLVLSQGVWKASKPGLPASVPAADPFALIQVVCPAAGDCVAVGGYLDNNGNLQGLIYTLSSGKWTGYIPHAPTGGTTLQLDSVACASATVCNVVGEFTSSSNELDPACLHRPCRELEKPDA